MNVKLIKDLILYVNKINNIPAILLEDDKLFWSTYNDGVLKEDASLFYLSLNINEPKLYSYKDNELFMVIPLFDRYTLIIGSVFLVPTISLNIVDTSLVNTINKEYLKDIFTTSIKISEENFIDYCSIIYRLLFNNDLDQNIFTKKNYQNDKYLNKEHAEYIFELRENESSPYLPELEKRILDLVKNGEVEKVKNLNLNFIENPTSINVNFIFKIVSLVTLSTRAVLEAGVSSQLAYSLSDIFLEKLGKTVNNYQVMSIAKEVLPAFAKLALEHKEKDKEVNPHLIKVKKYINTHLHYPITLESVAEVVNVNEKYLSRLFIKYEKEKFSHYLNRKRIEEACNLIINTNKSLSEIALSLSFSTQSYFIKIFKDITGLTPLQYKNKYTID